MNTAKQLSAHAAVAKLCRQYCKSIGVECRASSESYSMGNSVRVKIFDQSPAIKQQLESEFAKYQYGHFDGMTDMYEYTNSRNDIPQTKYLFIENRYSPEMEQKAWEFMRVNCSGADEYPVNFKEVPSAAQVWNEWVSTQVYRLLNGSLSTDLCAQFWAGINPPKPTKPDLHIVESMTIREGTKPGYSEVIFPSKPSQATIEPLPEGSFKESGTGVNTVLATIDKN